MRGANFFFTLNKKDNITTKLSGFSKTIKSRQVGHEACLVICRSSSIHAILFNNSVKRIGLPIFLLCRLYIVMGIKNDGWCIGINHDFTINTWVGTLLF